MEDSSKKSDCMFRNKPWLPSLLRKGRVRSLNSQLCSLGYCRLTGRSISSFKRLMDWPLTVSGNLMAASSSIAAERVSFSRSRCSITSILWLVPCLERGLVDMTSYGAVRNLSRVRSKLRLICTTHCHRLFPPSALLGFWCRPWRVGPAVMRDYSSYNVQGGLYASWQRGLWN